MGLAVLGSRYDAFQVTGREAAVGGCTVDEHEQIDIAFDFREDTPPGKDPDAYSPTLRRYHKLLWSKPLPNGAMFDLDDTTRGHYLLHRSDELGEFSLVERCGGRVVQVRAHGPG